MHRTRLDLRRATTWLTVATALIAATAATARAQEQQAAKPEAGNAAGAFLGAVVGGVLGLRVGDSIQEGIPGRGDAADIGRGLVVLGAMGFGMGAGAHIGNGAKGRLLADVGIATLSLGAGALILSKVPSDRDDLFFITGALGYLTAAAATAATEVKDGSRRTTPVQFSVTPRARGVQLAVSIRR